jgi:hypothetical protein
MLLRKPRTVKNRKQKAKEHTTKNQQKNKNKKKSSTAVPVGGFDNCYRWGDTIAFRVETRKE